MTESCAARKSTAANRRLAAKSFAGNKIAAMTTIATSAAMTGTLTTAVRTAKRKTAGG